MISATVIGRLGKDAELRSAGETPVVNFTIASNTRKKDGGQWVDATDWVSVAMFGPRGEKIVDYLKKGKAVAVRGALTTRSYEHNGQPRLALELRADDVELLGGKGDGESSSGGGGGSGQRRQGPPPAGSRRVDSPPTDGGGAGEGEDDIPF